jgi:hypothetical protein
MRFSELSGLTGLPIDRLRHRFRNEDVLTVLPVSDELTGRDCLLVATPMKLAVVIADGSPSSDEWMSRWAPWEALRFVHEAEPLAEPDEDTYRLTVHVGGLTFHARLQGDAGRRWLRDFVVAAQACREALTRSA